MRRYGIFTSCRKQGPRWDCKSREKVTASLSTMQVIVILLVLWPKTASCSKELWLSLKEEPTFKYGGEPKADVPWRAIFKDQKKRKIRKEDL